MSEVITVPAHERIDGAKPYITKWRVSGLRGLHITYEPNTLLWLTMEEADRLLMSGTVAPMNPDYVVFESQDKQEEYDAGRVGEVLRGEDEGLDEPLSEGFPAYDKLRLAGYRTYRDVIKATDEELLKIYGIAGKTLESIRNVVNSRV